MKTHIGVDAESGLVRKVVGAAANINSVTQSAGLQATKARAAPGDARVKSKVARSMRPGKRKARSKARASQTAGEVREASMRASRRSETGGGVPLAMELADLCSQWHQARLKTSVLQPFPST